MSDPDMCFSKPKVPEVDTPYVPPAEETSAGVAESRDNEKRRRASASGRKSTMLTGGTGSAGTSGGGKTLLGQ